LKRLILFILCIVFTFSSLFAISGCDYVDDKKELEKVSDLRCYYFTGNSDNYFVEMYGGKRESPFIADGAQGKLKDYVKIKVLVKSGEEGDYEYHIGINEEEYQGKLSMEVLGGMYVANLEATELESEYVLKITHNGKTEEVRLKSALSEDCLSWQKAKEKAEKELSDCIADFSGEYEVYVKFIEGERNSFNYFWYVAFLNGEKVCATLIDVKTGKIIAKRV